MTKTTKETRDKAATIASNALRTGKASKGELLTLAGSVLSQDQTKGKRGK